MSETNNWALPSGAKEQIGPKRSSRSPGGSISSKVMSILRFFRSGHRSSDCNSSDSDNSNSGNSRKNNYQDSGDLLELDGRPD